MFWFSLQYCAVWGLLSFLYILLSRRQNFFSFLKWYWARVLQAFLRSFIFFFKYWLLYFQSSCCTWPFLKEFLSFICLLSHWSMTHSWLEHKSLTFRHLRTLQNLKKNKLKKKNGEKTLYRAGHFTVNPVTLAPELLPKKVQMYLLHYCAAVSCHWSHLNEYQYFSDNPAWAVSVFESQSKSEILWHWPLQQYNKDQLINKKITFLT